MKRIESLLIRDLKEGLVALIHLVVRYFSTCLTCQRDMVNAMSKREESEFETYESGYFHP